MLLSSIASKLKPNPLATTISNSAEPIRQVKPFILLPPNKELHDSSTKSSNLRIKTSIHDAVIDANHNPLIENVIFGGGMQVFEESPMHYLIDEWHIIHLKRDYDCTHSVNLDSLSQRVFDNYDYDKVIIDEDENMIMVDYRYKLSNNTTIYE